MDDQPRQRYSMDIRVFLAIMTIAMAVSFSIGVGMGPPQPLTLNDPTEVHSVDLSPSSPSKKPSGSVDTGVHEPAGQVCVY
jgi:hypothetical protein